MKKRVPKVSQGTPKVSPKGAKSEPTGAKSEPKGVKSEPTGAKREPKVSQGATKMHPKINLRKRSRKSEENEPTIFLEMLHFGSQFPLIIDEKIDVKIDAEKVMKIDKKSMRK